MDLALYCPDCGFYEKEKDNVGKRGDFFTSVSVGDLFGQLLAFQFVDWFEGSFGTRNTQHATRNTLLKIVEAGAHDGRLARDILTWLAAHRPEIFHQLEYCIVEPSPRRRGWQQETLRDFSGKIKWVPEIGALKADLESCRAIIFSNELLDAMPVHRLGWDAKEKKWFEWGVELNGGNFAWTRLPARPDHVSRFTFHGSDAEKFLDILPDTYTIEISPAAEDWWRTAAEVLAQGKLLTIDYGFTADEQFSPSRLNGTVRAFHRHHVIDDLLANPGEQDLTAHVNFSVLQAAGESAGLRTETFCLQFRFLGRIAEKIFQQKNSFDPWGQKLTRQFQTLTHPDQLGRAFRVLIQSR